jgi:hypothetical protein
LNSDLRHVLGLFCIGFFEDRILWTICPSRLQTASPLISAFELPKITDTNHQSPDDTSIYQGNFYVHSGSFRPNTTIIGQSSIWPIDRYQKNNQWGNMKIKWTIDQMHLRNIHRMFYPRGKKIYIFS